MIVRPAIGPPNTGYFLIPEDSDDLFTLRRFIKHGDSVIADTTRVVKLEKEYGRPDKGERVKVRIRVTVNKLELDSSIDRLRVLGTIAESSNELIPIGAHHALTIQVGDQITVMRQTKWQEFEHRMLVRSGTGGAFVIVSIDTREAGIARISGTHVKVLPNIYSGQAGKRYQTKPINMDLFFADVARVLTTVLMSEDKIIIFGPGETRRRLRNFLAEEEKIKEHPISVAEGVDVAGEDGIHVFLRSSAIKEVMTESKLAAVSELLDEAMILVQRNEPRCAFGVKDVTAAANLKAVESAAFSDSVFAQTKEDEIVQLLDKLESQGAKTYAVDSSTDIGLRVSSLGGIVAILRYALR
jgi:protein pelota